MQAAGFVSGMELCRKSEIYIMHTKVLVFPRLSVPLSLRPVTEVYSDAIDGVFLHINRIL